MAKKNSIILWNSLTEHMEELSQIRIPFSKIVSVISRSYKQLLTISTTPANDNIYCHLVSNRTTTFTYPGRSNRLIALAAFPFSACERSAIFALQKSGFAFP
jgi:hypothetical protein